MIAKVKIAPVSRWCERYLAASQMHCIADAEIEILTHSMVLGIDKKGLHKEPCRHWAPTQETRERIEGLLGYSVEFKDWMICEHLLELD